MAELEEHGRFDALIASKTAFPTHKENFKLEDLSFPDTEYELRMAKGLTKKDIPTLVRYQKKIPSLIN